MDAPTTPDTTTYLLVHRALRTSSRRLAEVTAAYDRQDPRRTRSLVRWCEGFIEEIHCHHTIEDEAMFPALVARAPEAAELIARTDADHAQMDGIMVRLAAGLELLRSGGSARELHLAALELADLLDAHLAFEDEFVIPMFERSFTAEEYQRLDEEAMEILGISKQALFTVPFVLSQATDEEFEQAWDTAPAPFKVLYLASRGRYRRMTDRALGTTPARVLEAVS
ncbi:MAG TPA: hemerythrin domain-containing protein [Acidimicrobiales bacterium]|jgi:hemerythrin-like domain-containing protein|nr:hemerythrin domain-containing protein [Acidimicrobiales bacterium]